MSGAMDLDALLRTAVDRGATDLHLKLGRPPILRVDGELEVLELQPSMQAGDLEGVLRMVTEGSPKRLERFRHSGELDTAYSPEDLPRFRANAFMQRGTISIAFRIIPRQVPTFDELHLPAGVERLADERRGLVLCTGATGSGKTTTLSAILGHINRTRRQHIITIEDPIEILHEDDGCVINQREVGLDTSSFEEGLRRALRQDPDVILIGELRDAESAQTALQAAESGHLVLSTMHTVDAVETVGRMIEFFPGVKQAQIRSILAGVLRGVISQRLLPRVGGGRIAAVEIMATTTRIADLIREHKEDEIVDAIAQGGYFGMQSFKQALIDAVVSGEVDRETAANAATNRHDFLVALEHALKEQRVEAADTAQDRAEPEVPGLRVIRPSTV
jgi:twitching motility protein PilT